MWPMYWSHSRFLVFTSSPFSWGSYSDWNACLSVSAFPPDYQKHCHSLNFPFPTNNGSSSALVPEQQQARVWMWAAGGWGALCGGAEVCGWVFRLGSSNVHGAVALLNVQSGSHSSLLLFIPICTHYKQVPGALSRFPSVLVWSIERPGRGTAGETGALSFLNHSKAGCCSTSRGCSLLFRKTVSVTETDFSTECSFFTFSNIRIWRCLTTKSSLQWTTEMSKGNSMVVVQSLSHVRLFVSRGLRHTGLLCPPLCPGVCSNSRPLSQGCYLTTSFHLT